MKPSIVLAGYPRQRMRRMRAQEFARNMRQETRLTPQDLILPLFVTEGSGRQEAIPSMPGVWRYSLDKAETVVQEAQKLGLPAVALFPVIEDKLKSPNGEEAHNPKGLVPKAIARLKEAAPKIGVIADIALDPYTSHGQDGIIDKAGHILNDATIDALKQQAICCAQAGADIVAPSDMMDGRVGAIRAALDEKDLIHTQILSYAAKYASSFYGPFRDAVGSGKNLGRSSKETYQMNPANSDEALHEVALDLQEGADMVMVKPGLPYLDIIAKIKEHFRVPVLAYNVSGEYSMVKAAAAQGWLDEKKCVLEILLSLKRAGASGILTYHALDAARWL